MPSQTTPAPKPNMSAETEDVALIRSILEEDADRDRVPGTRRRLSGRLRRAGKKPSLFRRWRPRLHLSVLQRRPNWQEVALGALLTWFLLDPVQVSSLALLLVCASVLLCFIIGAQRIGTAFAALHRMVAKRSPDRAERLRLGAERLIDGTAELASWLPAHWSEGLYLPDLSPRQEVEDDVRIQRLMRMTAEK